MASVPTNPNQLSLIFGNIDADTETGGKMIEKVNEKMPKYEGKSVEQLQKDAIAILEKDKPDLDDWTDYQAIQASFMNLGEEGQESLNYSVTFAQGLYHNVYMNLAGIS